MPKKVYKKSMVRIIVLMMVLVVTLSIVMVLKDKKDTDTMPQASNLSTYTRSGENISLTQKEVSADTIIWSAKIAVSSGGHSLKVKEINQETGLVTLLHKKPGAQCVVTQAFETLEETFTLDKSIDIPKVELLETTYRC